MYVGIQQENIIHKNRGLQHGGACIYYRKFKQINYLVINKHYYIIMKNHVGHMYVIT